MNKNNGDTLSKNRNLSELSGYGSGVEKNGSVLDEQLGLRYVFGNEDLFKRVKKSFYDSNKTIMTQLNDALTASDTDTAVRICHTLKGLSNTLGAKRLHVVSEKLEKTFRDHGLSVASEKLQSFENELNLVLDYLRETLGLED